MSLDPDNKLWQKVGWAYGLVSVAVILVGAYFAFQIPSRLYVARNANKWPTTTGQVQSSNLSSFSEQPLRARYKYSVDGKQYESTRVFAYGNEAVTRREEIMLRDRVNGKNVLVYYDPEKTSRSVLEPNVDNGEVVEMFLLPAVLIIGGLANVGWIAAQRQAAKYNEQFGSKGKTSDIDGDSGDGHDGDDAS
ncbi:MAG: DUF3592 domain-containing protein [Planctomycetota bacterium]